MTNHPDVFKQKFIHYFELYNSELNTLASGKIAYASSVKDTVGSGAIDAARVALEEVLAILIMLGIVGGVVGSALTLGIPILLAAASIGGYYVFTTYRDAQKKEEYQREMTFINEPDFHDNINYLATNLAILFHDQLNLASSKDADDLAIKCMRVIGDAIKHNKKLSFEALFSAEALEKMLLPLLRPSVASLPSNDPVKVARHHRHHHRHHANGPWMFKTNMKRTLPNGECYSYKTYSR